MTYCLFANLARRAFPGIPCSVQANEPADVAWSAVLSRASRFENAE